MKRGLMSVLLGVLLLAGFWEAGSLRKMARRRRSGSVQGRHRGKPATAGTIHPARRGCPSLRLSDGGRCRRVCRRLLFWDLFPRRRSGD